MKLAIIGGTGFSLLEMLEEPAELDIQTNYGVVQLKAGKYQQKEVFFLSRHGWQNKLPPHKVNYRANISALKEVGVTAIFATSAVGSLNLRMKPGELVILNQFVDFTKGRISTFFDHKPVHIDLTEPYCPRLRQYLILSAQSGGLTAHEQGIYFCTEGPRFETPAEIQVYRQLNADLVGMTTVPEVILAREAEICYATVALVTNYAAGISARPLSHQEVKEVMQANQQKLAQLLFKAIDLAEDVDCSCRHALDKYEEEAI